MFNIYKKDSRPEPVKGRKWGGMFGLKIGFCYFCVSKMVIMRRFFIFATTLVLAFGAVSCHDDSVPEEETLKVEFKLLDNLGGSVNLSSAAAERTFNFSAPAEWTITVEDTKASSWLSVTPERGKTGERISVTLKVSENSGKEARKARVIIGCEGNHLFFSVEQAAPEVVVVPVEEVFLNPAGPLDMMVGDEMVIIASVRPVDATDKSINWSLDSEGIVSTVIKESSCTVTAIAAGSAKLTARAGDRSAVLTITVTEIPTVLPQSISLNLQEYEISIGGSFFLFASITPENVTDPTVVWASSDSSVAIVEDGTVIGMKPGEAKITASTCNGLTATCAVTVTPTMHNGYEYIDFKLPSGTMWAAYNVGAESPKGNGSYFAWGETQPKNSFTWDNYTLGEGSSSSNLIKYNCDDDLGPVDGKVYLELEDDAASASWGGSWQIPGQEQWQELIDNTSQDFYSEGTISGVRFFKEIDGKTVEMFVPRAGYFSGSSLSEDNIHPYWTNRTDYDESNAAGKSTDARVFCITLNAVNVDGQKGRHLGLPVRAVYIPSPVK